MSWRMADGYRPWQPSRTKSLYRCSSRAVDSGASGRVVPRDLAESGARNRAAVVMVAAARSPIHRRGEVVDGLRSCAVRIGDVPNTTPTQLPVNAINISVRSKAGSSRAELARTQWVLEAMILATADVSLRSYARQAGHHHRWHVRPSRLARRSCSVISSGVWRVAYPRHGERSPAGSRCRAGSTSTNS